MYDLSVEQIIKVKAPAWSVVIKVAVIAACVLAVTTIPGTYAMGLCILALFVVATVFVFKYFNYEYEYSLVEKELKVDKIISQSFRRNCGVYNIERASLIAPVGSQEALRMEHKQLKPADYTKNDGSDGVYVIYAYNDSNELVKIFMQPDERMLNALREAAPKGSFYENI